MPKKIIYKGVLLSYFNRIKSGAKRREIPFNITFNDLGDLWERQNICPYSGVKLKQFTGGTDKNYTASLDRIDPDKGYQIHNIQWVWKPINIMKRNLTDNDLKQIFKVIAANENQKSN